MNLWVAGLLAAAGAVLIVISVTGLKPRRDNYQDLDAVVCAAPAPDDSLRCDLQIGHYGWHRCGETEWFGNVWDVDQWAETQEAPLAEQEPTMSASQWLRSQAQKLQKPKTEPVSAVQFDVDGFVVESRPLADCRSEAVPLFTLPPELVHLLGVIAGYALGGLFGLSALALLLVTLFH